MGLSDDKMGILGMLNSSYELRISQIIVGKRMIKQSGKRTQSRGTKRNECGVGDDGRNQCLKGLEEAEAEAD